MFFSNLFIIIFVLIIVNILIELHDNLNLNLNKVFSIIFYIKQVFKNACLRVMQKNLSMHLLLQDSITVILYYWAVPQMI